LCGLVAPESPAEMTQPKSDWYDDALTRIWRTYLLIEELDEGGPTPKRELALRALSEAQGGVFLPLRDHAAPRRC
jgi:hypothetical protein